MLPEVNETLKDECPQTPSYETPHLIEYGSVEQLTQDDPSIPGGSGSTVIP
jgi:hypothetical protein